MSHATMAPAVVDPELIRRLSELLLEKSPMHLPGISTHPQAKALIPLIGLETGSTRMAKKMMPSKAVPLRIDDWPSVVIQGLEILNRNNWFPMMTLMIGTPGETDEDGVTETRRLSPLQWQLMMKCWKLNLRPGLHSWWGPVAFRVGGVGVWATRLRWTNGPNFTWALMNFCGAFPERWMQRVGKLHKAKPLRVKSRMELLSTIRSADWRHLRTDTGGVPARMIYPRPEFRPVARP